MGIKRFIKTETSREKKKKTRDTNGDCRGLRPSGSSVYLPSAGPVSELWGAHRLLQI